MFSAQTNNLQCIYPVEMMFQTNFVCTWKQRDEASLRNSILWGCILCGYAGGILCHISYDVTPFSYICQCHFHGANWKPEIQIYRMHSILMLRISPFYTKSEFPFWVTGKVVPRLSRRRKPVDNSVLKVGRASFSGCIVLTALQTILSWKAACFNLVHSCTIFLCCLDDPYRNQNMNNKDHRVG